MVLWEKCIILCIDLWCFLIDNRPLLISIWRHLDILSIHEFDGALKRISGSNIEKSSSKNFEYYVHCAAVWEIGLGCIILSGTVTNHRISGIFLAYRSLHSEFQYFAGEAFCKEEPAFSPPTSHPMWSLMHPESTYSPCFYFKYPQNIE